jgi:hypothetical protein
MGNRVRGFSLFLSNKGRECDLQILLIVLKTEAAARAVGVICTDK